MLCEPNRFISKDVWTRSEAEGKIKEWIHARRICSKRISKLRIQWPMAKIHESYNRLESKAKRGRHP